MLRLKQSPDMPIVITGVDGFIGKNLRLRLAELGQACGFDPQLAL